ncbi:MAG: hypothetical protein ACFFCD_12070 [Promethearchaeota archaeon]
MESEVPEEKHVKQCPNCKTFVQYNYSVCPSCGHVFDVPKDERKSLRTPAPSKLSRPRSINIILLLYFFFAAYMLLNGATAMIFLAAEGGLIAGLILVIVGIVDLVLFWFTRRKLRIAYLAGLVIGSIELVGLGALTVLYALLTGDLLLALPIFGLVGMKVIIVFLLFREKDYFTESLSGKEELPVKESIPEIPAPSYQTASTEPAPAYKAESINQVITTYLNAAKNSWEIAENAYKNAVWVEFILRADDAIQNLIKGRYIQLFGPIKPGMAVLPMVEAIRLRGYQLPESDEFEKWMAFREDVAKGTHSPEEMEVVKAYPFYRRVFDIIG